MKVLALVPDRVQVPPGGLGEQFYHLNKLLTGRVDYYVVAVPENAARDNLPNYRPMLNPFPDYYHNSILNACAQTMLFYSALDFRTDFDIIHAYDWSSFYAGVVCSWHFRKPLVCTVNLSPRQLNKVGIYQCMNPNCIDGVYANAISNYFEDLGLLYADKIIQVSHHYANLEDYKEYKDKTIVLHNGIDIENWVKKREPRLPGKNKTKLCYIGRGHEQKGLDIILNSQIPDDIDFYFVVPEKNADYSMLPTIQQKINNKNIFYIPGLYKQDKIDFLFAMDGVVMPSKHEPFGIVALEALASNNVLLTTAVDGIKEILEGVDYINITDVKSLEAGYKKVSEMSISDKERIYKQGRERAATFTWQKFADELFTVYSDLHRAGYNLAKIPIRTD